MSRGTCEQIMRERVIASILLKAQPIRTRELCTRERDASHFDRTRRCILC